MMRSLVLTIAAIGLLTLSGCIGSGQKRNPNIPGQRKDAVPPELRKTKSLVGNKRKVNYFRPSATEQLLIDLPRNSFADHDRAVYSTLGVSEGKRLAPVYPWFEVKELAKKKAASAAN